MPRATPSWLMWTQQLEAELRRHRWSRKAIISRNFQVVSTCSNGNGGLAGIERLHREVQQDRGILADRIEHDRLCGTPRRPRAGCGCSRLRVPAGGDGRLASGLLFRFALAALGRGGVDFCRQGVRVLPIEGTAWRAMPVQRLKVETRSCWIAADPVSGESQSAHPDRDGGGGRSRQGGTTYSAGGLSRGSVSSFWASNSVQVRPPQSPPNFGPNVAYLTCVYARLPRISRADPRILVRILP